MTPQEILKKPSWLSKKIDLGRLSFMKSLLRELNLNTVCESAACPNIGECFAKDEAAFMILGRVCSRNCKFCNVTPGVPEAADYDEPNRIAITVKKLNLKHVVITAVTRDDLSDGGAEMFADTVKKIKDENAGTSIEVLIPDFKLNEEAIKQVVKSKPDIIAHNIETVPKLYSDVRPKADYKRSLSVLEIIKKIDSTVFTKSGLMLGLGEKDDEVIDVFRDLRVIDCDFLSLGQYLSPSMKHYPVKEYIRPEKFKEYKEKALKCGFLHVESAPYVRSSYKAGEYLSNL